MRTIAVILLFILFHPCFGQNTIALPEIVNYNKQTYGAGTQNWDIRQDQNGLLYFGNNEGLLSFDGTYWKLYPLPNNTIVRAIAISTDGKIFVGGQNEFGFFATGKNGSLVYQSLLSLIPENDRSFDDVWNICCVGKDIFFRTNKRIFQLSNNKITVFRTRSEWRFLGAANNLLMAQDLEYGSLLFQNGNWKPFLKGTILSPGSLITSFFSLDSSRVLITTLKDGAYIYKNGNLSRLQLSPPDLAEKELIYKAIASNQGRIALATSFGGCHIIDQNGNLIQSFTSGEGLQTDNIRSIFADRNKNLWLGLNNGIDFVAYDNSIKHIFPGNENIGSGYTALVFNKQLFLGTSNGLFSVDIENSNDLSFVRKKLSLVRNSAGEVWNLSVVNDRLLMGHHNGAFTIQNGEATVLDDHIGFWTFLPLDRVLPSKLMVAGNYLGLNFYSFENGKFSGIPLNATFESARFVVVENENTVWVSHPYKGVYQVKLHSADSATISNYRENKGIFSSTNNYVFRIKNRIVVTNETGIYEYDDQKDRFEPSSYFRKILNEDNIRYLKEDPSGNVWFIKKKELGVVDFSFEPAKTIYFPELSNRLVNGFESVYPYDEHNIIIGSEKGFYHLDFAAYKRNFERLVTKIRAVRTIDKTDSLLYGGYGKQEKVHLPFALNSIHFDYSATLFGQQSNIEYSYLLKGFDKAWSKWSAKPEKDYTNLPAGDYVFMVKARNNLGNESEPAAYSFTVLSPWYRSGFAYSIYSVFIFGFFVFGYRWQKKKFLLQKERFEKQQKQTEYLYQLELEKNEKEIVKLRNEKLEAEIEHKNSELATSAMHLVQKREMIGRIRSALTCSVKKMEASAVSEEFKKLLKILGEDNKIDDSWEHFAHHFDKVHSDFLVLLKKKYPVLTAGELKLCAYLRMNLSNKEIAQLINISVRGVEIARYRLRKKLGLSKEINLFEFLLNEQAILIPNPENQMN